MHHPYHRQKLCALFEINAPETFSLLSVLPEEIQQYYNHSRLPPKKLLMLPSSVPGSFLQPPAMNTNARKVSASFLSHRHMFLLVGLGGLGVTTLVGGSLLAFSHLSTTSMPSGQHSHPSLPISMPLSKRSHHFLDENTGNFVNATAWSPDNSDIALANSTNEVSIWNVENQVLVLYYQTLNEWVNDVTWSKANLIAAATADLHSGSSQCGSFLIRSHSSHYNDPIHSIQSPGHRMVNPWLSRAIPQQLRFGTLSLVVR